MDVKTELISLVTEDGAYIAVLYRFPVPGGWVLVSIAPGNTPSTTLFVADPVHVWDVDDEDEDDEDDEDD